VGNLANGGEGGGQGGEGGGEGGEEAGEEMLHEVEWHSRRKRTVVGNSLGLM
jgi:hypothetical protein